MWTMLIYHTAIILGAPFSIILGIHFASSLCFIPLSPDPVSLFVVHSLILAEHSQKSFIKSCMGATFFETLYVWKCLYATFTRGKFDSVFQENSIMKAYFHLASLVNVTTIFLVMHALKLPKCHISGLFHSLIVSPNSWQIPSPIAHSVILLSCTVSASKTSLLDQTMPVSLVRLPLPSSLSLNYLISHSRGRSLSQPPQRVYLPNL